MIEPRPVVVFLMAVGVLSGCGNNPPVASNFPESVSPSAKLDTVAMLLEDLATPRHPSDGGGRAWLAGEYVYARVIQEDGGAAWSSPVFVE